MAFPQRFVRPCDTSTLWSYENRIMFKESSSSEIVDKDVVPSSVTSVLSNDDLLTDILLLLPALSLVLFKSVSKHWFNIIASPRFVTSRSKIPDIGPPFALLTLRIDDDDLDTIDCIIRSFDMRIPSKNSFQFTPKLDLKDVRILHSCNGLLLCTTNSYDLLFVYNPTINRCRKIVPPLPRSRDNARLVFDPTKSPHYKIIQFVLSYNLGHPSIKLQMYLSETESWSVCGDSFCPIGIPGFENGVYWNDAIHWLSISREFTTKLSHFKLIITSELPVLTKLERPGNLESKPDSETKLFESHGCLLLLGKDCAHSSQLYVYEMRHGYTEWSVKYIVNLDDIVMPFSTPHWIPRPCVCSIVLGEREADSFMIIRLHRKVVQYNPVLKTVCRLDDSDSLCWLYCFQFIASFAGV